MLFVTLLVPVPFPVTNGNGTQALKMYGGTCAIIVAACHAYIM